MGNENDKRRDVVGKGFERKGLVSILTLAVLTALLASIPSVSFMALAYSDTTEEVRSGPEIGNPVTIRPSPITSQVSNANPNFALANQPDRPAYTMYPVKPEGVGTLLAPNYVNEALESQKGGGASPTGGTDPEPDDAPFLPADVDVYVDAVDSQRNASMTTTSNDDIYVIFDHESAPNDRDVLVAKSTDGGTTWNPRNIATDVGEHERCPSIASGYSTVYGQELIYAAYTNPSDIEFSWSADGDTWFAEDLGGGATWWWKVNCPHMDVQGDFLAFAQQYYDDNVGGQGDTWQIFYTLDNFQTTFGLYYWTFWDPNVHLYQPHVSIIDDDELIVSIDLYDQIDPNPANWYHDTFIMHGVLLGTGTPSDDVWDAWWGSGIDNQDYTSPTIGANNREVVFAQEVFSPVLPLTTHMILCIYTNDYQGGSTVWNLCFEDSSGWLAFDAALDQKYPQFHREAAAVHAVWLNGTDISYRYSPDNGNAWIGDVTTGLPMKVNEPGVGTALDMWHSPDVIYAIGKPAVSWHDTRNAEEIYFQTWGNQVLFTIDTDPRVPELWVRGDGDPIWHSPSFSYLWQVGTNHDVETIGFYEIPNDTRYTFSMWDDLSNLNPHTITVDPADADIVAIYNTEYYLTMINPGGTTNPASGYQPKDGLVTIEAFPPVAPPGARYVWIGWTGIGQGSYTGPLNPCVDCVTMLEPITQIANWQLQWKVWFFTEPPGLTVEIDGVPYPTPRNEWFNDSEMYEIFAPSPQSGGPGLHNEFDHWSDGGAQRHNVSVSSPWMNFTAYFVLVDTPPDPPGTSGCGLTGSQLEDVEITWSLSADDGGEENDVTSYLIYRGTTYNPIGSGYVLLDTVSAGVASYRDVGGGHGDNNTYFYMICAVDGIGQITCDSQQSSKFTKHLSSGMRLLSIPLVLSDTDVTSVFQTVAFDRIVYYDAMAGKRNNWKTYDTRKPYSDLDHVNKSMAVWVEVNSDSQLTVAGLVPKQTTIHLLVGWNLVGYPSFASGTVGDALTGATYQTVESFDPSNPPWHLMRLSDTDIMYAGEGYWIHVSNPFDWILTD